MRSRSDDTTSEAHLEFAAACMRMLGHKIRIKLLLAIGDEPRPVEALANAVDTSQQNASKHLLALHRAGVIARQPRGREVYYSLVDDDTVRLVTAVRSLALRRLRQRADRSHVPSEANAAGDQPT